MPSKVKESTNAGKKVQSTTKSRNPRCLTVASRGIRTSSDFAQFMSHLMSDIVEGAITPEISNAAVNAGGKLLKSVELTLKYGKAKAEGGEKVLDLAVL